jgi:large subunit ribosomal protein L25
MHEESPVLTATKRERLGSRYCRRLRGGGKLPAVVYGHQQEPTPVALDAHDALGHIHKGEKVFRLALDGQDEPQVVLLKDVQFDHLGTRIIHADFARVDLDERVRTRAPLHLVGDAVGLKVAGAIMMHPLNEVELECRVADLPDFIEVDISTLEAGHTITAADIRLPAEDMKVLTDPHAIVAQIVVQTVAAEGEAEEVEAAAGEPEVISERKEQEEKEG